MVTLKEHQKVLLELLIEFDRVCQENSVNYILVAGSSLGAVRHQGFIPWDDDLDVALLREDYDKLMKINPTKWNEAYYLQREYSEHWPIHFSKLRKNNTTCLEKYHPKDTNIHQGIYIDIFPIDNASDYSWIRKIQFIASRFVIAKSLSKRGYETNSFLKKIVIFLSRLIPLKPFYSLATLKLKSESSFVHSFLGGSIKYKKGVFAREWFTKTVKIPFESLMVPVSKYYHELLTMQYGNYMTFPSEEERKCKIHAILVDTEKNYTEYEHYRDKIKFDMFTRSIR